MRHKRAALLSPDALTHIEDAENAENFESIDASVAGDWLRRSGMVSVGPHGA
jgi:hypothetical protein